MAQTQQTKKALTYAAAIDQLNKGVLANAYFIFGEEKYLHDELIDRIIKIAVNPATRDFNLDLFYANDVEIERVIQVVRSYPMMDNRRLVIIKDIQDFKPLALKHLVNYVASPSATSCLIMTMADKLRSNKTLALLAAQATAIDCRSLYDNEVAGWIQNYLKDKKLEIEMPAIALLQAQIGNSLQNLVNEIEKIQINILPRNRITAADVENVSSISKQYNVFELCNAVGERHLARGLTILQRLLQQGDEPTGIIIQLVRHFVNLLKVRECVAQGKRTPGELAAVTGLANYFVNDLLRQVKNFTPEQLRMAFHLLSEADYHLKTGYQRGHVVMELLLYKLIHN
ncbi:MAG: DNA polymerase III subunit delta [candidate division KSB1 bacterium]|nr:DNA polymerase III subunit delta [candidate division KSB1 bacterium]MDZ7317911.1 DNA polymerase III subunit delta [candidate division KSB1 bacterium]MDZ7339881.1 DNA polymerase III subunit delta [candidate division KSB1 bacterium]